MITARRRLSGCLAVVTLVITGVVAAKGVGDALVGGVGLAVDAVSVDLQQDGDAVAGASVTYCSRKTGMLWHRYMSCLLRVPA